LKHLSNGMQLIIRLFEGEDLIGSIEKAMKETYARNAAIDFGIGSLSSVEVGTLPPEGPHRRNKVAGPVELVLLTGLVVGRDFTGPYSSHIHAAIAGGDGAMRGGHLFGATVGAVVEVGLSTITDTRLKRSHDAARKIDLLDL
jgi:predicted DNA-binding protein with PD1-like motif